MDYYAKEIETMPRRELDRYQEKLLNRILRHAWDSRFYRDLWSASGFKSAPHGLSRLESLPMIRKDDLVANFPFGMIAVPRKDLSRVHITSGSTGRPVAALLSKGDIERVADLGARGLAMRGARKEDVVQITTAYGLWAAAFIGHYSAEKLGCMVIPSGPGNTRRQIWLMQSFGTTILSAVPSYLKRVMEVGETMRVDFTELPLRLALSTAGRMNDDLRATIGEGLGVDVMNSYGTTETGGIGRECPCHAGLHSWHDELVLEIVDPVTGEILGPGEEGEIVATTLARRAMPLIRYGTGDLGSVVSDERCECGRTHIRLSEDIRRLDDTVKIRGVLLSPDAVENDLKAFPELTGDFVIKVGSDSSASLFAEMRPEVETAYVEDLARSVRTDLKNKTGLTFSVSIVPVGRLPQERPGKRIQVSPDETLGGSG
jgi:phenylacetate-CoA ligase